MVTGLQARGVRAEISWLPLRAEYAPWTVLAPRAPEWATLCHINTWLHPRFVPKHLPVVATLHHSIHDPALCPYKDWQHASYHRLWIAPNERRILRRADRVVAVSQYVENMARLTLCDVPMQVIYNGVNTDVFCLGHRQRQLGGAFRLLYIGGWKQLKGVDLLAPIMRELGGGFELRYTGGVAAERDKSSMPANMRDLGKLSSYQVVAAMQDADALLFPSRSEGFGLVVAEAMACGLPVIAARCSSLVEVVEDGVTGLLCLQEDISAMVAAVRSLADDPPKLQAMRLAARSDAVARFSDMRMIDAYVSLYCAVAPMHV
ncbi:group 1 glycosyl transferase [Rhodanobacter thiooxydans]|uniref:Group 1 glycosyl transferase n=1 Tax=Rhodanobacter thiooxydans TaxID=416169 RepID=A0A154QKU5_9GAMM|nr:group 1 glycosyl transferase [Rhodanobacter thiooxydans]